MCNCDVIMQKIIEELEQAHNSARQIKESEKKVMVDLQNAKKQFEAQELVRVYIFLFCVWNCTSSSILSLAL